MAIQSCEAINPIPALFLVLVCIAVGVRTQLVTDFYDESCPQLFSIVRDGVQQAVESERRLAASILRLHFHDCFVNGCDASILLDDTADFTGEKTANPNRNSVRGFEVVDGIKTEVENQCPGVVSCADILTLAARDAVVLSGGPSWEVPLGRRDSLGASKDAANQAIPSPTFDFQSLVSSFQAVGLSASDMIILSGAHTIGAAQCRTFSQRLYGQSGSGQPDPSISPEFLAFLQRLCPLGGNPATLAALDSNTPARFDISYYQNLLSGRGVLHSDQALYPAADSIIEELSSNQGAFFQAFAASMVKMGNIIPSSEDGEIRTSCRFRNSD